MGASATTPTVVCPDAQPCSALARMHEATEHRASKGVCNAASMFVALLIRLAITGAAFAVAAYLLGGMDVAGGFFAYVWIAILFGIVNAIVGTVLRILTFPLTVLTLGLFSIIVNAVLLELTDALTSDLVIDSFFWTAIGAALIISITSVVIDVIIRLLVPKPARD